MPAAADPRRSPIGIVQVVISRPTLAGRASPVPSARFRGRSGDARLADVTAVSPPRTGSTAAPDGWRHAWTTGRARLWLGAAAIAAWLPILGMPLRGWLDFSAFYAAGQLVFGSDVLDLATVATLQVREDLPITPFVYPPGLALVYAPLSALPYGLAGLLHTVLMLGLLLAAAAVGARLVDLPRRWVLLGALAWAPAAAGVLSGQNTSLALLLVVLAAWALLRDLQGGAGLAIGLLAYKPQLGLPFLGLLLLRTRWAALLVSLGVLAFHWLAGAVAAGDLLWPRDWLHAVESYQVADFGANGWQAISLPALGRHLELVTGLSGLSLVGWAVGGLIVLACLPSLRRLPVVEAVALASACGLLISPHAWVYDATLLLPALGVFAARANRRGWPWQDRWWLAAAYAIALSWPLGGLLGVTGLPILVLATPFALLERGPFRPAPREGGRRSGVQLTTGSSSATVAR
jgi:hypothetical protein